MPVPSPDRDDVKIDNEPEAKRQKVVQDVSMEGPLNAHPKVPANRVAVPDVRPQVEHAANPRHQGGVAPSPEGRVGAKEQKHPVGNVHGAPVQMDEEAPVSGDGTVELDVVKARAKQGGSKSRARSRSRSPPMALRPRLVRRADSPADISRDRSRSRRRSRSPLVSRSRTAYTPSRSPSRSASRGRRIEQRAARARIANHPQAGDVEMRVHDDTATMVEGLVAKYANELGDAARAVIAQKIGMIAQPQQWAQDYTQAAAPASNRFAPNGREATGFWIYNSWVDGRIYGVVQGFAPPSSNRGPTFLVKVVGGDSDGKYEVLDADSGIYRPNGPFPVMAFAMPQTPHGKIPLQEKSRLEDQKLALTRAVVDEMVRREVNNQEHTYAQLKGYQEGQLPQENEIVGYARELANRFDESLDLRSYTAQQLWVYLDMGTRFGDVPINNRGVILQRLVLEMEGVWTGYFEPMVVDMDPVEPDRSRSVGPQVFRKMPVEAAALEQQQQGTGRAAPTRPAVDVVTVVPVPVNPASSTSWFANIPGGATTISIVVALIILVLLLTFSR